jgi:hypothetical protein
MYRQLFSRVEVAFAIASTAIVTAAALALGHGRFYGATGVLFMMVLGFGNIARGRERTAVGRVGPFDGFRDWLTVAEFGAVAVFLALAPSL